MLQFRALPVERGDAFLLATGRGAYLVDGGSGSERQLAGMLRSRGVKKLRAAIITHFDPDHVDGVLSLIGQGFSITECWLPQSLAEVCRTAVGLPCDMRGWHEAEDAAPTELPAPKQGEGADETAVRELFLAGGRKLAGLALDCALRISGKGEPEDFEALWQGIRGSMERHSAPDAYFSVARKLISGSRESVFDMARDIRGGNGYRLCAVAAATEARLQPTGPLGELCQSLSLAAQSALLLWDSPSRLRFFSLESERVDYLIPHSHMMCLNGVQVTPRSVPGQSRPEDLISLARGLAEDRFSRVFRYGDRDCSVLFCSDSSLPFLSTKSRMELDRPTLVTAPRHGGTSCDRVYPLIESRSPEEDVWVRSHNPGQYKTSEWFKGMNRFYCLNCGGSLLQEIAAEHDGRRWRVLSGNTCRH